MAESSTLRTLAAVLPLTAAAAQAAPPDSPAVLQAAQAAVQAELGVPVRLQTQALRVAGAWAFVDAQLRGADGRAFDYAGTPLADAAREGYVSRQVFALLARRDGHWVALELRVGSTDQAYTGWAARHHAPPSLFAAP